VTVLERVVTLAPDDDQHAFSLGAAYDQVKDKQRAIAMMERAIEINPENAAALNYLGYTYAEMGERLDEAESLIRRALAIEPHDGFYIDSLGWVYYQRGQYQQAVEQLERAVEQAGEDPTISEHLGDAYEKLGNVSAAIRAYQEALRSAEEREQINRIEDKLKALGAETRTSGTEL
jgi:tetratricopeptide (TPR) repeat protein